MKKISSKSTFFTKKIFPVAWFGFLAYFVYVSLSHGEMEEASLMFILVPIAMAVFGYLLMKVLIFDLIDEVYDDGDSLVFRESGKEVRVYLSDIKNISYQVWMNPPKVTLSVRHETAFGDELSFSPLASFIPLKKSKLIQELIDRIDQSKIK